MKSLNRDFSFQKEKKSRANFFQLGPMERIMYFIKIRRTKQKFVIFAIYIYIYINYFQGKFVHNDFYIGDKSRFYSRQPSSWKSLGNGLFIFIAAIDMRAWSVALKFFLPDETRETLPKEYKETEHKTFPPSNLDYIHDLVKKLCKKIFQISKTLSPRSFSMLRSKRS